MANFISIIKNASMAGKQIAICKKTKMNSRLLELLYQHGFIRGYLYKPNMIVIMLKYVSGKSVIEQVSLMSRASKYCYGTKQVVDSYKSKTGLVLVSCKKGIFSSCVVSSLGIGGVGLFYIK